MKALAGSLLLALAIPAVAQIGPFTITPLQFSGYADAMTLGPDGNIWYVDSGKNVIGRVPLSGSGTTFPVPTSNAGLGDIKSGPDGNLWFTEWMANKIGRITTSGTITEFPVSGLTVANGSNTLAAGSDGNLWFVARSGIKSSIGKISTTGASAGSVALPAGAPFANVKIAPGPSGSMWFHDITDNTVGPVGGTAFTFKTPEKNPNFNAIGGLTLGPDGNVWTSHSAAVARVTPSGTITEFPVPGADAIAAVTAGSDGNIWFGDNVHSKIGRLLISTATDQGTATIDQASVALEAPADLLFLPAAQSPGRIVSLDVDCSGAAAPAFVERSDDTPPGSNIGLAESSVLKCADIYIDRIYNSSYRRPMITALVRNGGRDDANVSVTITLGPHPFIVWAEITRTPCNIGTNTIICTEPIAAKSFSNVTIAFGAIGTSSPGVSLSVVGSSDLPDPDPDNNKLEAFIDLETGINIPPELPLPAPPPVKRH